MKLTMDEMLIIINALSDRSTDLSKAANVAESVDKTQTAKLFAEDAEKANALRDKLIANLDEMTI